MNATIRLAEQRDVPGILEIYTPFILHTAVTFEETVPDQESFWERIRGIMDELPFLVCEIDGRIAGYAYASDYRYRASYRWTKEVSVYVHPDFHRKKVAYALYTSLHEMVCYQGIANLLAIITMPNDSSVGFHEFFGYRKCGEFTKVGFKLNQWQNVGWFELFIQDETQAPKDQILRLNEIIGLPAFQEAIQKGLDKLNL
ncbi:MAG: N-acetyltransferase family protein [Bacteroidota bacterium]|nr:N-acetyltransferase [Odoribacter sp.]MDP3643350.1 N-acetyltransferase family protein [Bacteroidota bacterium]